VHNTATATATRRAIAKCPANAGHVKPQTDARKQTSNAAHVNNGPSKMDRQSESKVKSAQTLHQSCKIDTTCQARPPPIRPPERSRPCSPARQSPPAPENHLAPHSKPPLVQPFGLPYNSDGKTDVRVTAPQEDKVRQCPRGPGDDAKQTRGQKHLHGTRQEPRKAAGSKRVGQSQNVEKSRDMDGITSHPSHDPWTCLCTGSRRHRGRDHPCPLSCLSHRDSHGEDGRSRRHVEDPEWTHETSAAESLHSHWPRRVRKCESRAFHPPYRRPSRHLGAGWSHGLASRPWHVLPWVPVRWQTDQSRMPVGLEAVSRRFRALPAPDRRFLWHRCHPSPPWRSAVGQWTSRGGSSGPND
jgi:hypothetical protein